MTITELVREAHETAKAKGFHDNGLDFPRFIALAHSELSEALEAHRNDNYEHIAEELADVVIRVADTAGAMGIDLEHAIIVKMAFNRHRPHRHGKRY